MAMDQHVDCLITHTPLLKNYQPNISRELFPSQKLFESKQLDRNTFISVQTCTSSEVF